MILIRNLWLTALSVIICSILSYGQRTVFQRIKDVQTIGFDHTGQMQSFPGVFLTEKTKPDFTVRVRGSILGVSLRKMSDELRSVQKTLNRNDVEAAYNCFFEGDDDFGLLKDNLDAMIGLVEKMPDCSPGSWEKLISDVSALGLDEVVPVSEYLRNIQRQYGVEVYRSSVQVRKIPLVLKTESCADGCLQFSADTLRNIRELYGEDCIADPRQEFHFKLVLDDPWNRTIRDWYKKQGDLLSSTGMQPIVDGLRAVDSVGNFSNADSAEIYRRSIEDDLVPLKKWFVSWFWLTKGTLSLDPFNQLSENEKKILGGKLRERQQQLVQAGQQAVFLDSVRIKTEKKLSELTNFEDVQSRQQKLADDTRLVEQQLEDVKKKLENDASLIRLKTLSTLYEGSFKLSELSGSISGQYPQKQFDAARSYQPVKYRALQRIRVKEIPEGQQLYILAHNVAGNQGIRIEEAAKPFKDEELFTTFVSEQLSSFDFTSIPEASVKSLQNFAASFTIPGLLSAKGLAVKDDSLCTAIKPFIRPLLATLWQKDDTLLFPLNPGLFKTVLRSDPKFRTHLLATRIEAGEAVTDSIFLKRYTEKDTVKTTTVAKTSVKIGEMRYFMLAAGLAIHRSPLNVTTVDTIGGGLRTSTSQTRSRAIIGFKFYPFKNYNRDHSIIPRFPLRRLSIFTGFEMLKPLQNFYLGASYDIVPGLNISVGRNYALETRYRIQNNRITDTSRNYVNTGLYYSASVNPVLFVQFVKLFFK